MTTSATVVERFFQLDGVAFFLFPVVTFTTGFYLSFTLEGVMTGFAGGEAEVRVVLMTKRYDPCLGLKLYDLLSVRNRRIACVGDTP